MWKDREFYNPDITIVTALFDGRMTGIPHSVGIYDESWVDKLYRGIARNYSGTFDFICLTEKKYKFEEPIREVRYSRSIDQYGWMSLMEMYRPDLCTGKRFTIGLDTIITGPLDEIFAYDVKKVAVCTDPIFPKLICNAVTMSTLDFCEEFWGMWTSDEYNILQENKLSFGSVSAPSEMVLLRNSYGDSPCLDLIFGGRILSYKVHVRSHYQRLEDASIVYFHGVPKPHQILNESWVVENWK